MASRTGQDRAVTRAGSPQPDDHLDRTDLYAWTRQQAAALRQLTMTRSNTALDVDHVAEEIEDLGDTALDVVEGPLTQALAPLLKREGLPLADPRRHGRKEIQAFRVTAHRRRRRSPTLTGRIDLAALDADARRWIEDDLAEHGIDPALLPADCPYMLAQRVDDGFLPVNRHGLEGAPASLLTKLAEDEARVQKSRVFGRQW